MNTLTCSKPTLLERVVETIGELPTSPNVVSAIMGLTSDLNTEITKLSRVLSADQALTAKVLRLSNSPFYGRVRGVGSLDEAIMILGFFTIRSLVVASSAYSMFNKGNDNSHEGRLWAHSLATAMCARITARRVGVKHIEEVFLAGLLHDIGILILLKKMRKDYTGVIKQVNNSGGDLVTVEQDLLGFSHPELGALILDRWNFPPILSQSVRDHHDPSVPESMDEMSDEEKEIVMASHVVCFADELAKSLGHALEDNCTVELDGMPSVRFLHLSPENIIDIATEVEERFSEEQQLFDS